MPSQTAEDPLTKPLKLTDTQLMLLSAASQRDDLLLTCPEHLKGGAATAVLSKLLAVGLVNEVALGPDTPRWRVSDEGQAIGFRITSAGLDAIGIEPEGESRRRIPASCTEDRPPILPLKMRRIDQKGNLALLERALLRRAKLRGRPSWLFQATEKPRVGYLFGTVQVNISPAYIKRA